MNDPHVGALFYTIKHGTSVDYREAEPLDHEEKEFSIHIAAGQVRFTMKAHYATAEEAREAVGDYIRRWEFDTGLRRGPDTFELVYRKACIDKCRAAFFGGSSGGNYPTGSRGSL